MLYPYISEFNWIDVLAIVVTLRMCYIGIRKGIGIELFKCASLIFCSFAALHFYYALGELLHTILPPLPVSPAATFSYIVLLVIIAFIFRFIREGFFVFVKIETISRISAFLGALTAALRGVLITGLIVFGLLISNNHYLELSARTSILGSNFVIIPIRIYESAFNGIVARIAPDQSFNREIIKILEKKPKP